MTTQTPRARRSWRVPVGASVAAALALALGFATPPLHAAEAPAAPVASALATPGTELDRFAVEQRFDRVLASIQDNPGLAQEALGRSLQDDIKAFEEHRARQQKEQAAAFAKVSARLTEQVQAGEIEEAVVSAVDAHGLAPEPGKYLQDPALIDLVKRADAIAVAGEKEGNWLEALAYYRVLDLLFEDTGEYHNRLKAASRHVRVLRFYAPAEFDRLNKARYDRLEKNREAAKIRDKAAGRLDPKDKDADKVKAAEKPPKPSKRDEEKWQDKLTDVDMPMLRQTLNQASRRHVSSKGYVPLLRGSIDGLVSLINTKGLEATFPSFNDAAKLQKFRDALTAIRAELEQQKDNLNIFEVSGLLKRVSTANAETIALPESVLAYEMSEGAIDTLDEFSAVIWPRELDGFKRNFEGSFFGVGIQISLKDDQIKVVSPLEGTPAQKAGIKAGDTIISVDGRDCSGWSLDQAVREITGAEGTAVTIGISRPGKAEPLAFKLNRAKIPIESIRGWAHKPGGGWDFYVDREARIGYVRLSQFIPQSADDLDAAINQMDKDAGVDALIIDLRFDPGGLLSAAVEVSDRFIANGTIVSTVGPGDVRTSEYSARPERTHNQMPLIVLVNQGSASASEIVSGALQDHQRALIVGTRSFGKGSVQDVFPLEGGKALFKLTTQYYKLPNGRIIHRQPGARIWGIEPDVKVPMTNEQVADWLEMRSRADVLQAAGEPGADLPEAERPVQARTILEKGLDPQLSTALMILKTRLLASKAHVAQLPQAPAAVSK